MRAIAIAIVLTSIIGCMDKGERLNINDSMRIGRYDIIEADMRYVVYEGMYHGGVDIINVTLDSLKVYEIKKNK